MLSGTPSEMSEVMMCLRAIWVVGEGCFIRWKWSEQRHRGRLMITPARVLGVREGGELYDNKQVASITRGGDARMFDGHTAVQA